MTKRTLCWVAAMASALGVLAAPSAQAAYVTTFEEVGSNVVEVGGGTLDLTDLERVGGIFTKLFVTPNEPSYTSGAKGAGGDLRGRPFRASQLGAWSHHLCKLEQRRPCWSCPVRRGNHCSRRLFGRRAVGNIRLSRRFLRFTGPDAWLLRLQLGHRRPRRHVHAQCRSGLGPRAFDLGHDVPWICWPWLRGGAAKDSHRRSRPAQARASGRV